jgi:hypothetical protein
MALPLKLSTFCSPRVLTNSIDKLSKDGIMQRFIPIILRRKFNAVGDPIPKEMSVKPQWDNTARIVHKGDCYIFTVCATTTDPIELVLV